MCRERGSVLFYPKKDFDQIILKTTPEHLTLKTNTKQYAHLLSADDETILNEIVEEEKFELLKQLEEDGDQPEACFIKQALEENSVYFIYYFLFNYYFIIYRKEKNFYKNESLK